MAKFSCIFWENTATSGGGVLPIMTYTGRLHPKASGIWKAKEFTSWSTWEKVEKGLIISVISFSEKAQKG